MKVPYSVLGDFKQGDILIVGDHASNHVPAGINLGLTAAHLEQHIAWDIGVQAVAEKLCNNVGFSAVLGNVSRLVVDLNRYENDDAVIPQCSDGTIIFGNRISEVDREARLNQFYRPYHAALARYISDTKPLMLLSLHSFTPVLSGAREAERPWQIGILYNNDARAARIALPTLQSAGYTVGDQLPYSGKELNATMNIHGESNNIAYLGVEMRQDMVAGAAGQGRFATLLHAVCKKIIEQLGLASQNE
jgi:predicted N-formylglutamate amidohydrolase